MNWEVWIMRSRTSSCNAALLRKDLSRHAPLWLAWSGMFLVGIWLCYELQADLTVGNRSPYANFLPLFAVASFFYGFACAAALFGGLHQRTECVALHALPIRREHWFGIHTASGILMSAVPAAVFCAVVAPLCGLSPLLLFAGMQCQFLFFFGLGTLCMLLTGRLLAAVLFYGLFNSLSIIVWMMLELLYLPMLPGVRVERADLFRFCPLYAMMANEQMERMWRFGADWEQYLLRLGFFAVLGLALLALSLVLYRRRKLEYAGDFLAVKALQPVFTAAVALVFGFVGAVLALITDNGDFIAVLIALVLIGMALGYLIALMLIRRSLRIFDRRCFAGLALLLLLAGGSMWATKADVLGRVDYVPQLQQIRRIELRTYPEAENCYSTDEAHQFVILTDLHRQILTAKPADDSYYGTWINAYLTYYLQNGTKVQRYYQVQATDETARLDWYYSQPEIKLGVKTREEFMPRLKDVTVRVDNTFWQIPQEHWEELWTLVFADMQEGKMTVSSMTATSEWDNAYRKNYSIEAGVYTKNPADGWSYQYLSIPTTAEATQRWIEAYTAANPHSMTYGE